MNDVFSKEYFYSIISKSTKDLINTVVTVAVLEVVLEEKPLPEQFKKEYEKLKSDFERGLITVEEYRDRLTEFILKVSQYWLEELNRIAKILEFYRQGVTTAYS